MDFGKFDLAAQSEAGYVYHVADPLGEPMLQGGAPVTISVCGSDSPAYKNRQRELARENTDKALDRDDVALEMLIACTLGWQGIIWNGEELAFTPENVRMFYERHFWVADNVAGVILDRANFLDYAPAG